MESAVTARPTENGPLNSRQGSQSGRPINGLFRAPDVQSVERPPIRGLISLDIKPSRRESCGARRIDSACKMRAPSVPPSLLSRRSAGRFDIRPPLVRSLSLAGHALTLRLLIRTVDRTAKRRRTRKSDEREIRGGLERRGDEGRRPGGRAGGRLPAGRDSRRRARTRERLTRLPR